jgi:hypothetical protein
MVDKHTSRSKGNFHESFSADGDVKPPSARSTGFVFTVVALLVAVLFRHSPTYAGIAIAIAGLLLIASLAAPRLLEPLNIVWFKFGMLLHRIVNPVVMFLMFAVAFVPMGFLMRIFSDPLRLKRQTGLSTYWVEPDPTEAKLRSMKNQF